MMSGSEDAFELSDGNWLQVSNGLEALRSATRSSTWDIDSANGCHYAHRRVGEVEELLYVCPTSPDAENFALGWRIDADGTVGKVLIWVLATCACLAASITVPLILGAGWWTILVVVVAVLILPAPLIRLVDGGKFRENNERTKGRLSKSLDGESIEWSLGASTIASVQLQELVIAVSTIRTLCERAERYFAKPDSRVDSEMGIMYAKMATKQFEESGLSPESAIFTRINAMERSASKPS